MNLKLIMLCSFFLCSLHGCAQRESLEKINKDAAEYQLPNRLKPAKPELAGKVLIRNTSGTDLNYNIRPYNGIWQSESLRTGFTITYTSPGFTFSIQTPGKTALQYELLSGHSYYLALNKKLGSWDIYEDP